MKIEVIESTPTITVQQSKNSIQVAESKSTITLQENNTVIEVNQSSPTIVLQQTNNLVELGQQSINLIEVGIQGPQGIQGPAGPTGPEVSPGGSTKQIQYNNAGAFGGSSSLTWDESTKALAVSGKTTSTYTTDSALRNAFVTFPTTANRNDANFVLGHTFIPVVSMSVTQLGRLYVAGNTQDHQIAIWEKATGTLITSGTILAASSSDANNYKYVTVSAVTLDPAKEYVIGCQEFAAGDQWLTAWDSTNYFSPYVSRTGLAYKNGSTLGIPTIFSSGPSIYNTCTFKFTPNVIGQVSAAYDASNYISLISNSNGTGSIVTNNNDKTVAFFNNLGVGIGAVTSGFKAEITGGLRATGTTPIRTVGTGGAAGDTLNLGVNSATSVNGIAVRGGYILIESGGGADVLINYDNPTKNVGIGGIFSSVKLGMLIDSASKKGLVIRMAASPTANPFEIQDSTGTLKGGFNKDCVLTSRTDQTNRTTFINSLHGTAGLEVYPIHADGRISLRNTIAGSGITFWHTGAVDINSPTFSGSVAIPTSTKWGTGWSGNSNNLVQSVSSASGADAIIYLYPERYADATANAQPTLKLFAKKLVLGTKSASSYLLGTPTEVFVIDDTGLITISCASASTKGLIVKAAASQTANLQEWQDSAGTALAFVSSAGAINSTALTGHTLGYFGSIDSITMGWPGTSYGGFQAGTNGLVSWALRSVALSSASSGVLEINNGTAGTYRDLKLRDITLNPSASLTPATNGSLAIEATSNTSLTFKYKGSDGVVRSASLTLT